VGDRVFAGVWGGGGGRAGGGEGGGGGGGGECRFGVWMEEHLFGDPDFAHVLLGARVPGGEGDEEEEA